jgi:hypothetical protein
MAQKQSSRAAAANSSARKNQTAPTASNATTPDAPIKKSFKLPSNVKDVTSRKLGTMYGLVGSRNSR